MRYLRHPNIMNIRDVFEDHNCMIIVMDLMINDFRNVIIQSKM